MTTKRERAIIAELLRYKAAHGGYPWTYEFCIETLKGIKDPHLFLLAMAGKGLVAQHADPDQFDLWRAVDSAGNEAQRA